MNARNRSGNDFRPQRNAANNGRLPGRNSRPKPAFGKSKVLARFQAVYLSVVAIVLIFIIVFSFLIKGRINQILGMGMESGRPDYDVFPYHTMMTNDRIEETEEEEDPDATWPDADDYDMGDLPPIPRVPAAPPQAPGYVTQATTTTEPVTDNSSEPDTGVTEETEPSSTETPPTSPAGETSDGSSSTPTDPEEPEEDT